MENIFDTFASPLIGLPVRHIWQGYGSAIFLEFGELRPRLEQDGSASQSEGQMGLMIERSWRIEDRTSIRCGSWSDEALWPDVFALLLGSEVRYVKTFGRLPEIEIGLSNGMHILSFMTAEGLPMWTLFDRRSPDERWLSFEQEGFTVDGRSRPTGGSVP
jgi:hypothetical protein